MEGHNEIRATGKLTINEIYAKHQFNLLGVLLCIFLLIMITILIIFIPSKLSEIIISYALAPIGSFVATVMLHFRYKQVCSATNLMDNHEFIINDKGILRKCTYSELKLEWSFISVILYDEDYYYIFLKKGYYKGGKVSSKILVYTKNYKVKNIAVSNLPIKIPKRFFKSKQDIDRFEELCRDILKKYYLKKQGIFKHFT